MKQNVSTIINELIERYPKLQGLKSSIMEAFELLRECCSKGGKVLVCGNGGSASDAEHIAGELMKGFNLKRNICAKDCEKLKASCPDDWKYISENLQGALPAISLVSHTALSSAYINDVAADMVFAQQVYGYGKEGDVLIALSTSGNSKNVVNAIKVARAFGIKTIGMTGGTGGLMKELCDVIIKAPESKTYKVQELHLPIYHALCAMLEIEFFGERI